MAVGKQTIDHYLEYTFSCSIFQRCGVGRRGTNIVDEIDQCCKAHDACYEKVPYWISNWVCQHAPDTVAYKACMCDKIAAQCFAANKYDSSWKGRCQ